MREREIRRLATVGCHLQTPAQTAMEALAKELFFPATSLVNLIQAEDLL